MIPEDCRWWLLNQFLATGEVIIISTNNHRTFRRSVQLPHMIINAHSPPRMNGRLHPTAHGPSKTRHDPSILWPYETPTANQTPGTSLGEKQSRGKNPVYQIRELEPRLTLVPRRDRIKTSECGSRSSSISRLLPDPNGLYCTLHPSSRDCRTNSRDRNPWLPPTQYIVLDG